MSFTEGTRSGELERASLVLRLRVLDPFDHDVSTLFAQEASSAPAPSYLMRRDLATSPTPDLLFPSVELGVLFHRGHGRTVHLRGA